MIFTMKKSGSFVLGGALLLILIVGMVRHRYPDWLTCSNASPHLDGSTPAMQNGLELLGIVKTGRDAYTLVLNAPSLPRVTSDFHKPYDPANAFALEATSSQGQSWKVGWRLDSSESSSYNTMDVPLRRQGFPDPMLLAELPLSYPPGCRWVDVDMTTQSGQRAHWRLTDLQTARNIVSNPQSQPSTYAKNGVFLRLDGQWRHWDSQSHQEWRGELNISGCVTPNPARKWCIEPTGAQSQWISYHERQGPSLPEERFGTFTCGLPPVSKASLSTARPLCGSQLMGYNPHANHYGVFYFDLLEYQVAANGQETLLARTPLSLTALLQDKGSQEKLYPQNKKASNP